MGTKRRNGKLYQVSAPATVSEGRASRAKDAGALTFRRLDGEEGAIAKLVFCMSDPDLFGRDGPNKQAALERVRAARKRVRATVGDETQARELFALASVQASDLRQLREAHPSAQSHLVEQRAGAVKSMREFHVATWTARTGVAVAARMQGLALALLDAGAKTLDVDTLKAARELLAASRLHRADALDTDRRAKLTAPPPVFQWQLPVVPPGAPAPSDDEPRDGEEDDSLANQGLREDAADDDEETPGKQGVEHHSTPVLGDEGERLPILGGLTTPALVGDPPPGIGIGRTRAAVTVGMGAWDPTGKPRTAVGPSVGRRMPDGSVAPSDAALAEMKRKGLDTSRWEEP